MSDNEAVSPTVVETVLTVIQSEEGIDADVETQLTKVLEKLNSELTDLGFTPSAELAILTEELMASVTEPLDDDFSEFDDDDDDDDFDDDDDEEEDI